jgi:hypothetical protein
VPKARKRVAPDVSPGKARKRESESRLGRQKGAPPDLSRRGNPSVLAAAEFKLAFQFIQRDSWLASFEDTNPEQLILSVVKVLS